MNQVIQLSSSSGLINQAKKGKNQTPGDIGVSLFNSLLQRISKSFRQKGWGLSLYETSGLNQKTDGKDQGKDVNPLLSLNKKIRELGVPVSQLVLPETALPQVIFFLEKQGLSKERIDQLIQSARCNDGSLRVDPFLPFLINQEKGVKNQALVIQSKDVPRLEEALYNKGMGAGEIKEIIEKSVKPDGDVDLDRLSSALLKFRSTHVQKDFISLLERFDIKNKPNIIEKNGLDPELKKELINIAKSPSQDVQQNIKQNISSLLIQKGIPPQDVKSFLEGLNIQYAKSTLRATAPPSTEPNALLSQVTISNQSVWGKGGWDEKILAILQGERVIITKGENKGRIGEKGEYRLNMTELSKHGDTKARGDLFKEISLAKRSANTDDTGHQGKPVNESKGHPQAKEGFATGLTMVKQDVAPSQIGQPQQSKTAVNLPQPLPKIVDRMFWMIRAGEQHGRMILNPPEMGRLDLDLSIKHSHIQVHMGAESVATKELIEAGLGQLRQQLSDQGFIVEKFEVMVGLNDKRENENGMWAGHGRKRNPRSKSKDDEKIVESVAKNNEGKGSSKNNLYQIDVHV